MQLNFDATNQTITFASPISLLPAETVSLDYKWDGINPTTQLGFTGNAGANDLWSRISTSGNLEFNTTVSGAKLDGVTITSGSALPTDNAFHTLELTSGGNYILSAAGDVRQTPLQPFRGVIKNLSVVKAAGITTWAIDSGSTTTESPTVDANSLGNITFNNVIAGDWA